MQFQNPNFFIALIAILIPIIVHLFTFKRYKKVYFSNVSFLKELQIEKQKHSRLKHLIVLCLRVLAISALVFAFAQPFIPFNKENTSAKGTNYVSIYIDNSFSMQNAGVNGNLLDEAKQKAREILEAYKPEDRFQLLTNDFEGKHTRFVSKDDFLQFLEEVNFSPASTSLSQVSRQQQDFFSAVKNSSKTAYLISDLQKSVSDASDLVADSTFQSFFVPIQAPQINNLYIDSVWFETPVFRPGATIETSIKISNMAETAMQKIPVKLEINGTQRATAGLDIEAQSSEVIKVPFKIDETGGILQGKISLSDYPITFDDDFYFSLQVQNRIPVLCINNRSENRYLKYLFSSDSSFIFKNMLMQEADFDAFSNYYLIILNELDNIPSGMAQSLAKFVENGGSLLVFPSGNIQTDTYNTAFDYLNLPHLGKMDTSLAKVNYLNEKNVLYSGVFESVPENMELPNILKHYTIETVSQTAKESLMKLQNGDDFLLVSYMGKGKIYLCTSPAETGYSNFPKHVLFVPTLFNMAFYSQPISPIYYILGNQMPIDVTFLTNNNSEVLKIQNADNSFEMIPELRRTNTRTVLFIHGQIKTAGNYWLRSENAALSGLSFNYNRLESNMASYKISDIEKQLKDAGLTNYEVLKNTEKPLTEYLKQRNQGIPLFKYFILLALACLLAEVILLRWLGK